MSASNPTSNNNLQTYVSELLSPASLAQPLRELPALSKYAILLEGEHISVALLLDDFAGVIQFQQHATSTVIEVDDLINTAPKRVKHPDSLIVKIRDLPIALACKRVETIIDLNDAKLAFHYDKNKPWSAGMIQSHWAMLLDVSKLIDICA